MMTDLCFSNFTVCGNFLKSKISTLDLDECTDFSFQFVGFFPSISAHQGYDFYNSFTAGMRNTGSDLLVS